MCGTVGPARDSVEYLADVATDSELS